MPIRIHHLPGLVQYADALALQEQAVEEVLNGGQQVAFFLEHPPIFTLGSGADAKTELLNTGNIPTVETGRGGKTTYHGPGQRVVYVIRDLRARKDIRAHITDLQNWLIASLADLGIQAHTTDDVGVWVGGSDSNATAVIPAKAGIHDIRQRSVQTEAQQGDHIVDPVLQRDDAFAAPAKIAAIGVRVRKWVAFHGIALNVEPDLSAYKRIIPCGLNLPVTSLRQLGVSATMQQVDEALAKNLPRLA